MQKLGIKSPNGNSSFPTLLDSNYRDIKEMEISDQEDIIDMFYQVISSNRRDENFGDVGEMGSWNEFQDAIDYDSIYEQYNVRGVPREYAIGMRITRKMVADDLTGIMRGDRFRAMARAGVVTRQEHGTRLFEMLNVNDTYYYNRSEALPLASSAHTTRTPGVATTSGFSNLLASKLSQVAVRAAMIQMRKIASDRGKRSNIIADEIYVPIDLIPPAEEIFGSVRQLDSANNNINPEKGKLKIVPIPLWSTVQNWGIGNSRMRKENAYWIEREEPEYGKIQDFDTFQMKWRGYQRHGTVVRGWRWAVWSFLG